MTAAPTPSGRRSGRVEDQSHQLTETAGLQRISAPESIPSSTAPALLPERRVQRMTRRRLLFVREDLSAREQAILASLSQHRFLTTSHLLTLHFHDHATPDAAARICRRVLARLAELRVIEPLERRVGGIRAGSASYVWRVGLIGDRLLRQAHGAGARLRRKEPAVRYLDHCLAIADCHVALVLAARQQRLELLDAQTEPRCWRSYLGASGSREILKPDLRAVTATGEFEDHWMFEVDRATESLPTVLGKCRQYERYRRTGREQADGGVFPRVVWVVPDARRAEQVAAVLRSARSLDRELFRVTTLGALADLVSGGAS